jgi:general secretion pathway protein D
VRNQDVSDLNLRPIDVGTANNVELRFANHPGRGAQGESPATPPTTPQQPQGQALPNSGAVPAPPQTQPEQPASGGAAALRFEPASITTTNGATFSVNVNMTGGTDVAAVPVQIAYDPKHLSVVKIDNGDFLTKDSQPVALVQRDDPNSGMLVVSASRPPGAAGVSGQGTVFTITFTAKDKGPTVLSIARPGARNSQQQPIQVLGSQMTVNVQ